MFIVQDGCGPPPHVLRALLRGHGQGHRRDLHGEDGLADRGKLSKWVLVL
jgi:hypothetical protein